MKASDIRSKVQ